MSDQEKIVCRIDGAMTHNVPAHIRDNHPTWSVERYKQEHPGEPLYSEYALKLAKKHAEAKKASAAAAPALPSSGAAVKIIKQPFHQVFEFGMVKAALNARGEPIQIDVFEDVDAESAPFVQPIDQNYVFPIEETKNVLIGFTINVPIYIWGYHGTGKTTLLEQICARTNRPFLRIQHTANTEESQIVGQYVVRDGATIFQPGPLMDAMRLGLVYCADEYDFAMPNVTSVYQPVLEGKALIVKEAPPEMRVVQPHPNFRFVATGNTNGCGDETGLYQGTNMQNAANYSRFGITIELGYMEKSVETSVIQGQAGIKKEDAKKLVEFAKEVRTAFAGGKIGSTVSPRELIRAGLLGRVRGSDWRAGLKLALTNRMSRVDREVVEQLAQRIFN